MKSLTTIQRIVLGLNIFFAFLFLLLITFQIQSSFNPIVKVFPIWGMAYLLFSSPNFKINRSIGIGLGFSGIGDIVLMFDGMFLPGLISFLIAHLFYIHRFSKGSTFTTKKLFGILPIFLYGIGIGIYLNPYLKEMTIPVYLYLTVILGMGVSSILGKENHVLLIFGAIFFIASDSILSIQKFVEPIPYSGIWIMTTYYAGQFLIAIGSLSNQSDEI
jgi:uncharacterized membrane protein YhhN